MDPMWTPGALLAEFIKKTTIHCYTQNMDMKYGYESSEPCGCRVDPRMDPRGTVGRIYIKDHYTLLHTKYESSGPCGFGEEDFLKFFT